MALGTLTTTPAKLGSLEFDAIMDSEEKLSAEAPTYATESGFAVGDSVIIKPTEVSISAIFSNSPVTWSYKHGSGQYRIRECVRELRSLFRSRQLFTYEQNGEVYENMAIIGLSIPDKPDEHGVLTVKITMKQITVTETQTALVSISYPRGGTTGTNTGSSSTTKTSSNGSASSSAGSSSGSSSGEKQSALYSVGKMIGLY